MCVCLARHHIRRVPSLSFPFCFSSTPKTLEGFGVVIARETQYPVTQQCHHAGQIFRLLLKISVVTLQVEINSISEASAHSSKKQIPLSPRVFHQTILLFSLF